VADQNAVAATQDILANMTKGVFELKGAKAAGLTPVGLEVKGPGPEVPRTLGTTAAPFPNDHPTETINNAVAAIRREVGYIIQALDAIDATNGVPQETPVPQVVEQQKQVEQAADEAARERAAIQSVEAGEAAAVKLTDDAVKAAADKFAADYAAKSAEAQAQVFTSTEEVVCPTHGEAVTRKLAGGKTIRMCSTCKWREGQPF
jgi:hypothetical protein